jgi:hypothetical protein
MAQFLFQAFLKIIFSEDAARAFVFSELGTVTPGELALGQSIGAA